MSKGAMSLARDLSSHRLIVDGTALCLIFTGVVYLALYLNPWLGFDNYPPDVKAAVSEVPHVPLSSRLGLALPFLTVVFAIILRSTTRVARSASTRSGPWLAMLHAFLLLQIINAWDLVVVDWLIFVTIQPDFVILPGTMGAAGYHDYGFHFRQSYMTLQAWAGTFAAALVIGALASWLARRETSRGPEGEPEPHR